MEVTQLNTEDLRGLVSRMAEVMRPFVTHPEIELYQRKDLVNLFKVSYPTIDAWASRGVLRPYKIGKRTFFKKSEVMDVLKSQAAHYP